VNSVCHVWGTTPFRVPDQSRNNFLVAVPASGEGWHNNHHAFPYSARHGLRWWQLDLNYLLIRGLALVGLAWDVKVPNERAIQDARQVAAAECPTA
jgi:stearoyl-CoA desaturase (delta-9 desaturase)